jgi:hypothetical protein
MTGPEFAQAHGNDASTWTTADFETEINLAEIDALTPFQQRLFDAGQQVYDRITNPAEPPFDVTAALMDAHYKAS